MTWTSNVFPCGARTKRRNLATTKGSASPRFGPETPTGALGRKELSLFSLTRRKTWHGDCGNSPGPRLIMIPGRVGDFLALRDNSKLKYALRFDARYWVWKRSSRKRGQFRWTS